MDLHLENDVIFIAGASRGIGRAIAAEALAEGASVVLTGRDDTILRRTHAEFEAAHGSDRVWSMSGDLLDPAFVDSTLTKAVKRFGTINHLVANVGAGRGEPGWRQSASEWHRLFEVNFFGSVRLTQSALPYLLGNADGGSILYIASIVGLEATPAPLPYSAAKAALLNYAKNLSLELAPERVRVNSIAPGNIYFEGGSWHEKAAKDPDRVRAMLDDQVPQRRFGAPADIAKFAAFLCSSVSGFATGSCFVVDGGQTRRI